MNINTEQKLKIVETANNYIAEKSLTQSDFSTISGINPAYLSSMLKGKFVFENKDVHTDIQDKWFRQLAESVGYSFEANPWSMVMTIQSKEILGALEDFKNYRRSGAIICDTGYGKTYTVDRFVMKHPGNTIRITVSSLYRMKDIVLEIAEKLGLPTSGMLSNNVPQIKKLIHEFRWLHRRGQAPILILDEAENMNGYCFRMIKALYDGIAEYCPIILIGTDELERKLLKSVLLKKDGMPQFYRRFKAGFRRINRRLEFVKFYEKFKVELPLQKLLNELCDNYGELHDYLEPVMKHAVITGKPVTEDLFRLYHNIPKYAA